jgi:hypothetical protein
MDLQEVGWGVYWTELAHYRKRWRAIVNTITKVRVPKNGGKLLRS